MDPVLNPQRAAGPLNYSEAPLSAHSGRDGESRPFEQSRDTISRSAAPQAFSAGFHLKTQPPAWMEIDLSRYRSNWEIIRRYAPPGVQVACVVKDDAYGHGAIELSRIALEQGASMLAVATVREALELRSHGFNAPILLLGERAPDEYACCLEYSLWPCIGSVAALNAAAETARQRQTPLPIHLKIDTGMSRYGFRWSHAPELIAALRRMPELKVVGAMSHFAMSDELDKTFARLQLARFQEVLAKLDGAGIHPQWRHICNSGGLLDLPEAHFNLVRIGILPLGVYPSKVCRRLDGIEPVMSVRARLAALKDLEPGDHVGYGMRFTAERKMRIGVVPVGYGYGYPRVRNQGHVIIRGKFAPLVGGVSMDAITVDLSRIPDAQVSDVVTLLGRDGASEISIHEIAALRNSVSYDAMVSWSARLPRKYLA